jgi:hypothetical protein
MAVPDVPYHLIWNERLRVTGGPRQPEERGSRDPAACRSKGTAGEPCANRYKHSRLSSGCLAVDLPKRSTEVNRYVAPSRMFAASIRG